MCSRLIVFCVVFGIASVHGQWQNDQTCTLDDVQRTPGEWKHIRQCPHALNLLRAGVLPKQISDKQRETICCPTQKTMSQKKCDEWKRLLYAPKLFTQQPFREPTCAYDPQQPLIVAGRDAAAFEFPHAVALGFGNQQQDINYKCGGTLISEKYVLTAAHCIKSEAGPPKWALIGDITLDQPTVMYRKVLPIVDMKVHPKYAAPLTYNDIALLKLGGKPLDVDRYILPACLPDPVKTPAGTDTVVEAVGWGKLGATEGTSNILQATNLSIISHKNCDSYYSDAPEKSIRYPQGISRSQMCALDQKNGDKDTCNGDSGGPLTVRPEIRCLFHVVGITSFGAKLCGYGQPGVYTKVLSNLDWIERTVWG